jgi:nucleotide-binding universal stress UspA family protein
MAFRRILLPVDGSVSAEAALPHAARLARAFSAKLILFRVLNGSSNSHPPASVDWRMRKAEATRYLKDLAGADALSGISVSVNLTEGRPADAIVAASQDLNIDLIVMSAYGAGESSEFPLGGTTHKVLAATQISVAVVRQDRDPEQVIYRRILVPLDGSQQAELALQVACAMAAEQESEILLLHVATSPAMPRRQPLTADERELCQRIVEANSRAGKHYLAELERQMGARIKLRSLLETTSNPVLTIKRVAEQEHVDLLIMSGHDTEGENGWSRNGVCQSLLAISRLPVMILHANPAT